MFINAHILVLKTLGNIQYAEHKWSIQEHSLAWRHKVAWPSKRMNGFDVCFPESGRVWESDSAASHAGAGAAGSSLRDAAQRLSEEAPGGRHGPQPGREWDMFMCFKHSMCVCVSFRAKHEQLNVNIQDKVKVLFSSQRLSVPLLNESAQISLLLPVFQSPWTSSQWLPHTPTRPSARWWDTISLNLPVTCVSQNKMAVFLTVIHDVSMQL